MDYFISAITEQVTQTSTKSAKMEIEQAIDIKYMLFQIHSFIVDMDVELSTVKKLT